MNSILHLLTAEACNTKDNSNLYLAVNLKSEKSESTVKQLVLSLASEKCKLFSQEKNEVLSYLYDRKFQQSYTISVMVLINAAANHVARSDRCLPNRELANIFQTLALTWFTLQTVLSKWQTNSLPILSRSNNPSHPLHLARH